MAPGRLTGRFFVLSAQGRGDDPAEIVGGGREALAVGEE
jgi:hypothetical protein